MTTTLQSPTAEQFGERLFGAVLGLRFARAAHLGNRLGWYRALAAAGALIPAERAARTATAERCAREWCEHQAVCGVLVPDGERFRLPPGPAEALTDELSPAHLLPMIRMTVGLGRRMDALVAAYRSGGGGGRVADVGCGHGCPRSGWRSRTRRSRWTGTTWTLRPWRRPAETPSRPEWPNSPEPTVSSS